MPQVSYLQNAIAAQPGMAFDAEASARDVVSFVAAANIPFGVLCELNATNQAQPVQSTPTTGQLAGTVTVTNASTAITFSASQTLPKGALLEFSAQPGVVYKLAAAVAASTAGTLTNPFSGLTLATGTTNVFWSPNILGISLFDPLGVEQNYVPFPVPPAVSGGSQAAGWLKGQYVPFMRRGRIWVAGDAGGTALTMGPINVWHSSTGANPQGVFTFSPTSQTVGAEVDVAPNCAIFNPGIAGVAYAATYTDPFGNTFKVYPVEILAAARAQGLGA